VIVGRRAALDRGFETMFNDLRSALSRLERQTPRQPSDLKPHADPRTRTVE
jgi:ribonuclease P protein component